MNTEIKARWTAALRSGDYEQTVGALHRTAMGNDNEPIGYCCLGVLCEIAVQDGVITSTDGIGVAAYAAQTGTLPNEVVEWAELDDDNPSAGGEYLTALNDDHGLTFDPIADLIEEYL